MQSVPSQSITRRLVDAKRADQVVLEGIAVELVTNESGSVQELILRDAQGREVRATQSGYSLAVRVPAPPKLVERWRLAGRIPGIRDAVLEYFEYEHQAEKRLAQLDEALRVEHDLRVEKVSVSEEEAEAHAGDPDAVLVAVRI